MPSPLKSLQRQLRQKAKPPQISVPTAQDILNLSASIRRLSEQVQSHRRETYALYNSLAFPAKALWQGRPVPQVGSPAPLAFPTSSPCRQDSFETGYFSYWTRELHDGLRYHRKLWEFVFICQALYERQMLVPGMKGLGFGVGSEPLTAYFASKGCEIMATDIDLEYALSQGWTTTNQHADGKEALRKPHLCADDLFDRNVSFLCCDMNAVPDGLTGYDFCWSACALEHLGSIEHGLAFIERSIETLKPGGWAIHTTEFNTSSNLDTIDHEGTVLFRRCDFAELAHRLAQKGHTLAPLDFNLGDGPVDRYIDVPPYRDHPHLQLLLGGFSTTSYGLIIQRGYN